MSSGVTRISDAIVPSRFTKYVQQMTERKSRLVQSGALVADPIVGDFLQGGGGGLYINIPKWKDLDNDAENISTDDNTSSSTPNKIGSFQEIGVRLSRNQSWSDMDLVGDLAGSDPGVAIAGRVSDYWVFRRQAAFIAMMKGVFADNDAAVNGGDQHVVGDMTHDIKGGGYSAGVTTFSAEAVLDALLTMGDSSSELRMCMMHSIVLNRAKKNNLIDFIPDSEGRVVIPTFLGRLVIEDDDMPTPSTGVFETWFFGPGSILLGVGSAKVPTETFRNPEKGTGGGMETLFSRVCYCMHPRGYQFIGSPGYGGPTNAATSNNLAAAASWSRVAPERKMVKIARLVTREF